MNPNELKSARAVLRASPETVVWGAIPADRPPVLRIRSGDTVVIETDRSSPQVTKTQRLLRRGGSSRGSLPEAMAVCGQVRNRRRALQRVLTRAGDGRRRRARRRCSTVRVLVSPSGCPSGVNGIGPGSGVLPDLLSARVAPVIRLDLERRVALFAGGTEIPLAPFMGIMSVAPPPERAPVSTSRPANGAAISISNTWSQVRNSTCPFSTRALCSIGRWTCSAGRRRGGWRDDRDFTRAHPAVRRSQACGQAHEVAARGGRCLRLRDGDGRRSRSRAEGGCARKRRVHSAPRGCDGRRSVCAVELSASISGSRKP